MTISDILVAAMAIMAVAGVLFVWKVNRSLIGRTEDKKKEEDET